MSGCTMPKQASAFQAAPAMGGTAPQQRVVKVRRDYNAWVARETMEDYALRFTPRSFRKWSEWRVAHYLAQGGVFLAIRRQRVGGVAGRHFVLHESDRLACRFEHFQLLFRSERTG